MELSKEDTTSSSADMLRHELEQAYDSLEKLASSANADQHGKHEMSQPSCDEIDRLKADLTQLRTDYEAMQFEKSSVAELLFKERDKNEALGKDFSELESISGRLQSKEKGIEFETEMAALRTHAAAVEEELEVARRQYDVLQESYRNSVSLLETRLVEITGLLSKHDLTKPLGRELERNENVCNGEVADKAISVSPAPPEKTTHLTENNESSQNSESNKTNPTSDPKRESGGSGRRKRNRKKKRSLART